ncbi:MAG: phage tail protein [Myxococcota bacterium]
MSTSREQTDPYNGHYFALEINNQEIAHFQECSGLKSVATVYEIEEGGMNGMTHKRPGQSRWENIVLRYATSASTELLSWRDQFLQDQFGLRTEYGGAIILYDNAGTEIRRYSFSSCWPVSWEGPSLNSGSSELAVETLEIAHDGLTIS